MDSDTFTHFCLGRDAQMCAGAGDPQGPLSAMSCDSGSNYPLTARGIRWVCLKASWFQQLVTAFSEVSPVMCLSRVCVFVCIRIEKCSLHCKTTLGTVL